MLSKLSKSKSTARLANGALCFFSNPFCTVRTQPETPELLKAWVILSQNPKPSYRGSWASPIPSPEEDYVSPSISDWVENRGIGDQTGPVDQLSDILNNRTFPSPSSVAHALSGCSGVDPSDGLVERVLARYSTDWIRALGVLKWAKSQAGYVPSADAYDAMIDISGKAKQFELVWELVEEMHGAGRCVSLVTLGSVAIRYAKAKRWRDVVDAFGRMEQYGVGQDVAALNVVLDALVKERNVELARSVLLEFKSRIRPNIGTFNVLIHGLFKARRGEAAWRTVEEMQKHGIDPDVVSYTNMVDALCRVRDFSRAEAVLEKMQENGCTPNVMTYTVIITALGKIGELYKALQVYERMKRNGCKPNTALCSCLIFQLSKADRLEDAVYIFKDMKRQGVSPDTLTYNTMILMACDRSAEETALKLLREMEVISCKPDLRTYGPLLKMCCKNRRMKLLFFLLGHMFRNDVAINDATYSLLVHGLCSSGKLEHACMFFEESAVKGFAVNEAAYNNLLKELEKSNMKEAKNRIEGLMSRMGKEGGSELQDESVMLD